MILRDYDFGDDRYSLWLAGENENELHTEFRGRYGRKPAAVIRLTERVFIAGPIAVGRKEPDVDR